MALASLIAVPGQAQVYPGGGGGGIGYPGGGVGYPGGGIGGGGLPFPGRGRRNTNNNNVPTENLLGTLQTISPNQLSMVTEDRLQITVMLANNTKYVKESGSAGRNSDFSAGDRISVDANQDNSSVYHAVRVTQVRVGNADDKAATSGSSRSSSGNASSNDDDSDRPRLHRADNSSSSNNSSRDNSSSDPAPNAPTPRPQIARADPPQQRPAPSDPTDPGPPQLRRGRPAQTSAPDDSPIAGGRPSIHAEEVNGVTKAPAPPRVDDSARPSSTMTSLPRNSGDPIVEAAREAVFSFSETLPNYVVKQFTTRYATETAAGGKTSWQALDNVTADVIAENGAERYKNILVNGKAPKEAIEKTGSWSSGEFSSLLQDVFSTATNAEFHGKRATSIVNRQAYRYDFSVEQPNSHWHVEAASQTYLPAYTGTVWIDKETSRVLRVEMAAQSMPKAFPLDTVESAVDYDFVLIGDSKFLLPVHSEALSCERGSRQCSRNVIDFRNYKKFGAESSISFGGDEPSDSKKKKP